MKKRVNKLPFASGVILFILCGLYLYLIKVSDRFFSVDGTFFAFIIIFFALLLVLIGLLPQIEKFFVKDWTEDQKEAAKRPAKGRELVFVILGAGLMFFLLSAQYFFPNSDFVQTYLNGIGGAIVLGVFFGLSYLPIYFHKRKLKALQEGKTNNRH